MLKVLAATLTILAVPSAVAGTVSDSVLWSDLGWTLAGIGAALALARASIVTRPENRTGWRLLAWSGVAWVVGQLCWDLYSLGLPAQLFADFGWLAFAPLSAIGLASVGSMESRGRQLAWETVPVIAATGALITTILYGDIVTSTLGVVERWATVGFPVTYAIVPVMTAQVLLADRIRISRRPDLIAVMLGIAIQAVGFILWTPRVLHETYQVGTLLDLTWTAGLALITLGALTHRAEMAILESGGERRFATLLPATLLSALLGLLVVGSALEWPLGQRLILEAGALGVGTLIGVRLTALSRRQRELLESERRTRNALEQAADELTHVALHDALTKLPNRSLFLDRTTHALAAARRTGTWTAVLFLDVDDFKRVNDVFGHSMGDDLLRDIAIRLSSVVRPSDTVARFGGDEFTVLCPGIVNERHAVRVANRIIEALGRPFQIGGRELHSAASVGIAFSAAGTADAESLVRDADTAMYRAKEKGRGGYEVFDETVRERVVKRLRIEDALRSSFDDGELRLAYQPFLCLQDQRILGFEALLRWDAPEDLGDVPPSEFIPIAEQSGLMQRIGAWTLDEAARTIAELRASRPELNLNVTVNLSARQVLDPSLPALVRRALRDHDLPAHALALEITESDLLDDGVTVLETLAELRALGIQLMLDDFGTGFSSLNYLKRFPVDALKIDRSFVAGLGEDAGDRAIIAAIMGVAEALDLRVIAEGVETDEQAAELVELGCSIAQGFRYAQPMFEPQQALDAFSAAS